MSAHRVERVPCAHPAPALSRAEPGSVERPPDRAGAVQYLASMPLQHSDGGPRAAFSCGLRAGALQTPTKPIAPSLLSTSLQQHVLHPSWIDIFPEPKRRDNMILSGDAVCGIDGGSVHWHVYISGEYREGPHLMVQGMKKKGERV